MKGYQAKFIDLALRLNILQFGEFELKSGRKSPYFFNMGQISAGTDLLEVARCYAKAIVDADIEFDLLFGPAYKGIPLVTAISLVFATDYNKNIAFAYNRKEIKQHGEGGQLVGLDVANKKVLVIDDVMTAGTAIRQACELLQQSNASVSGILIALDREETSKNNKSTTQEFMDAYHLPVQSIVNFSELLMHIQYDPTCKKHLTALENYRQNYGAQF